jgi:hypothetical protein
MAVERTIADMTAECKQLLHEFSEDRERYVPTPILAWGTTIQLFLVYTVDLQAFSQRKQGKRGAAGAAGSAAKGHAARYGRGEDQTQERAGHGEMILWDDLHHGRLCVLEYQVFLSQRFLVGLDAAPIQ